MTRTSIFHRIVFCTYFSVAGPFAGFAQDASPWKVEGKLRGKPDGAGFEKAKDVSGLACAGAGFPRLCLLVDDETQGAQIVVLRDGELQAGEFIRLSEARHGRKQLELDAEAVAFDDGHFYVSGSYGRPRRSDNPDKDATSNAKAAAARQLFRVTLAASDVDLQSGKLVNQPRITPSPSLAGILQSQPELAAAYDRALADNGLTIEGLAVRDGRLLVGLRGPVIGDRAAVLSVALPALFDGPPSSPRLHKLALETDSLDNPRGVRDLVRHRDGFLVLAGPVNDPPDDRAIQAGDYAIYGWDGDAGLNKLADLEAYGQKTKPEALLPLDRDGDRLRVLLLFDGPKEGAPRPLTLRGN